MSFLDKRSDTEKEIDEYYKNRKIQNTDTVNNHRTYNNSAESVENYTVNSSTNNNDDINDVYNQSTATSNRVYVKTPKKKNIMGIIFFILFPIFVVSSIIISNTENSDLSKFMTVAFPIIIIVLFAVVGFSIAFVPIIKISIKKSRCKHQLKATIIDVHWRSTSDGGKTYVPTYQYFYAGKEYIATSYSYNGVSAPEIGSHIDILINENNPEDY